MIAIYSIFIFIIGLGLLLLGFQMYSNEGFTAGMPGVRCGIDLPTCNHGSKCFNGFCSSQNTPILLPNQLPVYP